MSTHKLSLAVSAVLICLVSTLSTAQAAIYTQDFNSYVGNQNANQADTGLPVAFGGTVTGITSAGGNALHAVQLNATPDWSIMFYGDNTVLTSAISGANALGTDYELTFDYGTAEYSPCCSTQAGDGLTVEIRRVADSFVLATQAYQPGAWGPGNYNLDAGLVGTLAYTGDGTGDVEIFVRTTNNFARFEGSIDNLSLDTAAVPEPTSLALAGMGLFGLALWGARHRSN